MKFDTLISAFLVLALRWKVSYSQQQENSPALLPVGVSNNCSLQDNVNTLRRSIQTNLEEKYNIQSFSTRPCSCGGTGWTRVAYLNMSDPQQTCPSSWALNTSPVRGCGRTSTRGETCDSVVYPVNGLRYSRVCGMVTAYHKGWADGFRTVNVIDDAISGVSLTLGSTQHIWTL